ncbi:uncharacterized protein LOC128385683 [Panonychus citri]|uniref:uncharacterized protein LOC128385683 n=1 Tax=Panonychus citri TaxID=50023 RepID=UPI002307A2E3|nr:uncharacterized protein LOC128385683 [Panonychus citri]
MKMSQILYTFSILIITLVITECFSVDNHPAPFVYLKSSSQTSENWQPQPSQVQPALDYPRYPVQSEPPRYSDTGNQQLYPQQYPQYPFPPQHTQYNTNNYNLVAPTFNHPQALQPPQQLQPPINNHPGVNNDHRSNGQSNVQPSTHYHNYSNNITIINNYHGHKPDIL